MNESLGQRIKRYRNQAKLSQAALAKACGWDSQSRIGNYEKDTREPTFGDIELIAKALGVKSVDLLLSQDDQAAIQAEAQGERLDFNVEPAPGPVRYYEYPEISWVQAGMPVEAIDPSNIAACEQHPSDAWAGDHGFWLRVNGSSMTSQNGLSFIEGMVILVAPGFDVETGNYVVAKLIDSNEATFKQLVRDAGKTYLKPLNPSYPTVELDNAWVIVGKVVDAKWPRAVLG